VWNLIALMFVWINTVFPYYLITFEIKYLNGNIFYNTFLSSFSELLGAISAGLMFHFIGVKPTLVICFGISVSAGICYI
jgi:hypothetical protein